ncbi:MAG: hypothetical protein SFX74_11430 [Fimbriimonadaceae bacterium]|nr:hypothetical protein [Fimbriimonadaceae bacterium]
MLTPALFLAAAMLRPVPEPEPRIVLVPTHNLSGERWADLRRKQSNKIDQYLVTEFGKRKVEIVPRTEVEEAIKRLEIDFSDEEQLTRATMFRLGRELRATYLFLPVILATEQNFQDRDLYTDREGRTDVKVWFLDVANERPLVSARTFVGRSGGMRITLKPSDRQIQAAANAVRDSLAEHWGLFSKRDTSKGR